MCMSTRNQNLAQFQYQRLRKHRRRSIPIATYVPLVCDREGCGIALRVKAVRPASATELDVCNEVAKWKLHDLFCPAGHPILEPKIQPEWEKLVREKK